MSVHVLECVEQNKLFSKKLLFIVSYAKQEIGYTNIATIIKFKIGLVSILKT